MLNKEISRMEDIFAQMGLIEIKSIEELNHYRGTTDIGSGTYNTALHSLKQGKPTYIKIVE